MDIRSSHRSEWRRLLRERWPRPMDEKIGWTPEEGSAVICVIIVMKMVISYTDDVFRLGGDELEWVKAEKEAEGHNVLLKYAWHDTSEGVDEAKVLQLQEEVYKELMGAEGQWARAVSGGVTFEKIMECLPMWKYFWSRPEFRLWVGLQVEDVDGLAPLERVLKDDGSEVSATMLAKQSLVRWCSDNVTLEERLVKPSFRTEGKDQEQRRLRHVQSWSLETLECLRVEYDPGTGDESAGFQDLVRLSISPQMLQVQEGEAKWMDGHDLSYRLVAAVRLGSPAYIRTYDKAGQYLVPRAASSQAVVFLSRDWQLGQAGAKYMLYYVLANPRDPYEVPTGLELGHASAVDLQQQSTAKRIAHSPPPRSAPTAPRADRERAAQAAFTRQRDRVPVLTSVNRLPLGRGRQHGDDAVAVPSGHRGESPRVVQGPAAPAMEFKPRRRRLSPISPRPSSATRPHPQGDMVPRIENIGNRPGRPPTRPELLPLNRAGEPVVPNVQPRGEPSTEHLIRRRKLSGDDGDQPRGGHRAEAPGGPPERANPGSIWGIPKSKLAPRKRRRSDDDEQ